MSRVVRRFPGSLPGRLNVVIAAGFCVSNCNQGFVSESGGVFAKKKQAAFALSVSAEQALAQG